MPPPSFMPRRRSFRAVVHSAPSFIPPPSGPIPFVSLASHSTNILTWFTAGERTLGRQCRAKNLQTNAIITKSYFVSTFRRAITAKRQVNFQKSR
jgi:hypothetical protein